VAFLAARAWLLYYRRLFRQPDASAAPGIGVWRLVGIAGTFAIFSSPTFWLHWRGAPPPSYIPTTVALGVLILALVVTWRRATAPRSPTSRWPSVMIGLAGCALLVAGAHYWVGFVVTNPIDPNRGDMLPIMDAALRRFMRGRDPYGIYHVPWEVPLPWGPVLWAPFLVPHALGADLRFASVVGQLIIPVWCVIAAVLDAARGRVIAGMMWLLVVCAVLSNPDIAGFTPVAHTPGYWPLLPLFAILVAAERWQAAAVVLGLIVVGRSTMAAGAPVFLFWIWVHRRALMLRVLIACAAPVVLLILPFALWDPHALWYGMVSHYPHDIKTIVWPVRNQGVDLTIGLTGWLVAHGLQRFVEASQVCAVILVYIAAWFGIRRGGQPIPWMVIAVLAFCMTTLWPMYYIYFEVLLLLVVAAIAETVPRWTVAEQTLVWTGSLVAAAVLIVVALAGWSSAYPTLDFRRTDASRWLYTGFLRARIGGETLPWIWGTDGTVSVARLSNAPADVVLDAQPVVPRDAQHQTVTALLNGRILGTVQALPGWQELRFAVPSGVWLIGANELKLTCGSTTPPILVGLADDQRHLALGVRQISIMPAR
jgi:hypothetical protein